MEGYAVVANDGHHMGRVDRLADGSIVVEHGTLHHRFAVPHELAHVDEDAKVVHLTVAKELLHDAPKVHGDAIDKAAVAGYHGYEE